MCAFTLHIVAYMEILLAPVHPIFYFVINSIDINLIISFPFMHFNPYRVDVTVNDNYFGK